MKEFSGISGSDGVAIGPVLVYRPAELTVGQCFVGISVQQQLEAYTDIKRRAVDELSALKAKLSDGNAEQAAIFEAHQDILDDVVMDNEIRTIVSSGEKPLDEAISCVYNQYAAIMDGMGDPVFKERAKDIEDVCSRLIRICSGKDASLPEIKEPSILAAADLLPSDTASLNRNMILAIVTEKGGQTSHSAIIARSYGIPALLGVGAFLNEIDNGQTLVVDACDGVLIAEPDAPTLDAYAEKSAAYRKRAEITAKYLDKDAVMRDGTRIDLTLNIASGSEDELAYAQFADGVGLFRTEFLFMGRADLPNEEEQVDKYSRVLTAFGDKPVILRTLDIGGDKQTPCLDLPQEENPFLGKRALRLCFDQRDIFKTQLRAALRASVCGRLWLMLPMVGSMDDIYRAKGVLAEVKAELDRDGIAYAPDVKLGIMIEIPSIALLADRAAEEVDFASIGSNDLCQYLMAADRLNPEVSEYYQSCNPAMFRLIGYVAKAFAARNKPVSLCGELGGNARVAVLLVGLGLRKLSMGADALPRVKESLSLVSMEEAEAAAKKVCGMCTGKEVEEYLQREFSLN